MAIRRRTTKASANAKRAEAARRWRGAKAHHTKLTAEAIVAIAEAIEEGLPLDVAASAGSIHRSTLRRWLQRAETFIADGGPAEYRAYSRAARLIEAAKLEYIRKVNRELNDQALPVSRRRLALDLLVRRGILRGRGAGETTEEPVFDEDEAFL